MRQGAKTQFARQLRGNMTDAERRLWLHLCRRQLDGSRFRRQHPMGPYVADFACLERRLVVEIDGGQHDEGKSDARRNEWFRAQGFSTLRFWNNDVLSRTEDVLEEILKALGSTCPHPGLPPQAGEGDKMSKV
jgi:very-short-patch-repair endonuclease